MEATALMETVRAEMLAAGECVFSDDRGVKAFHITTLYRHGVVEFEFHSGWRGVAGVAKRFAAKHINAFGVPCRHTLRGGQRAWCTYYSDGRHDGWAHGLMVILDRAAYEARQAERKTAAPAKWQPDFTTR